MTWEISGPWICMWMVSQAMCIYFQCLHHVLSSFVNYEVIAFFSTCLVSICSLRGEAASRSDSSIQMRERMLTASPQCFVNVPCKLHFPWRLFVSSYMQFFPV
jgi:hypothetical protein